MTAPDRRGFVVAAVVLSGALALAGTEGLVRLAAQASPAFRAELAQYDLLGVRVEPHGLAGYRPRPGTAWQYPNGAVARINAQGFRGPVVPVAPSDPATLRVVLLGGSTTFGWGVDDDETIDATLRRVLPERLGGRPVEVLNAGFDGYDSWQLLERLRHDVVPLRPDLIVVNAGINDVRGAQLTDITDADPRMQIWGPALQQLRALEARGGPHWTDRLKHASHAVRFAALLRGRLRREPAPGGQVAADVALHQDAADYFERNLRRVARIAQAHRMSLVLSTPPSALRERHEPGDTSSISYWVIDAARTAAYRDTLAERLEALAEDLGRTGQPVVYVRPVVPPERFLDDAHLDAEGNRLMAEALAQAIVRAVADGESR